MFLAGALPFTAIYLEVYYIFSSIWSHNIYTLTGVLLLAFVILIVVCACVTLLIVYYHLAAENWQWWWRSFFCGGYVDWLLFVLFCFVCLFCCWLFCVISATWGQDPNPSRHRGLCVLVIRLSGNVLLTLFVMIRRCVDRRRYLSLRIPFTFTNTRVSCLASFRYEQHPSSSSLCQNSWLSRRAGLSAVVLPLICPNV